MCHLQLRSPPHWCKKEGDDALGCLLSKRTLMAPFSACPFPRGCNVLNSKDYSFSQVRWLTIIRVRSNFVGCSTFHTNGSLDGAGANGSIELCVESGGWTLARRLWWSSVGCRELELGRERTLGRSIFSTPAVQQRRRAARGRSRRGAVSHALWGSARRICWRQVRRIASAPER